MGLDDNIQVNQTNKDAYHVKALQGEGYYVVKIVDVWNRGLIDRVTHRKVNEIIVRCVGVSKRSAQVRVIDLRMMEITNPMVTAMVIAFCSMQAAMD